MPSRRNSVGPSMAPTMPVTITMAAESDGRPPMASLMPMAIGVLTVLGPSESRVSGPAPSDAAIAQAVTVAVSTPAISPASTGHAMRLKVGRHRYNGTAMATVAGPSSHWTKPAPRK